MEFSQRLNALRSVISHTMTKTDARVNAQVRPPMVSPRGRALPRDVEVIETEAGPLHVRRTFYEPQQAYGRTLLTPLDSIDASDGRCAKDLALLALDDELREVDVSRVLVLDTETTGLAGGAGTVPFMVGLGFFQDGAFVVEQLLLRDLGEEAPLLTYLAERLRNTSLLLTYNGKRFDMPLLRTRFIMNRVPMPPLPPHADLLHCARRVLKSSLESMRLVHVEREWLGVEREDDVPGAQIPELYFGFLRGADAEVLTPVLDHNRLDIASVQALLHMLLLRLARPDARVDAKVSLALAQLCARGRQRKRAGLFADAVIEADVTGPTLAAAYALKAELARGAREHAEAVRLLHLAVEAHHAGAAPHHLMLAKLYEHRMREMRLAMVHARLAARLELPEVSGRRMGRLFRKLERSANSA